MPRQRGHKYEVTILTIAPTELVPIRGFITKTEDELTEMQKDALRNRSLKLMLDGGRQIWLHGQVFENTRLSFTPAIRKRRSEKTEKSKPESEDGQLATLGRGQVSGASSAREIIAPRRYVPPSTEDQIVSFNGKNHTRK